MGFDSNLIVGKVGNFSKAILRVMHQNYENVLKGVSDGEAQGQSEVKKSFQRVTSAMHARSTPSSKMSAEFLIKHGNTDGDLIIDRSNSFFLGTIIVSCVCAGILIYLLYTRYKSATKASVRRSRSLTINESTLRLPRRRLNFGSQERPACAVTTSVIKTEPPVDKEEHTIFVNQNFKAPESESSKQMQNVPCEIEFDGDSLDTSSFIVCCQDTDDDDGSLEARLDVSLPDLTNNGKPIDPNTYLRLKYLKMGTIEETNANGIGKCIGMEDLHLGNELPIDGREQNANASEMIGMNCMETKCKDKGSPRGRFTTRTVEAKYNSLEANYIIDSKEDKAEHEYVETPTQTDFSFLSENRAMMLESANINASVAALEAAQEESDPEILNETIKAIEKQMENKCFSKISKRSCSRSSGPIKAQHLNYAIARRHSWTSFKLHEGSRRSSPSPTPSKTSNTTSLVKKTETVDHEKQSVLSKEQQISKDDVVVGASQKDISKEVSDITCEIIGDGPQIAAETCIENGNTEDIKISASTKTLTESVAESKFDESENVSVVTEFSEDVVEIVSNYSAIDEKVDSVFVSSCSEITSSGTDMNGFSSDDHCNLNMIKKELIAEAVELKKLAHSVTTTLETLPNNKLDILKPPNKIQNFKSKIRKFTTKKQMSFVEPEVKKPTLVRQPSNVHKMMTTNSLRSPVNPGSPRNALKPVGNKIVRANSVLTAKEQNAVSPPVSPRSLGKSRIPIPTGRKYPEMANGNMETLPSAGSIQRRTSSVTPGEQPRRPLMQRCSSSINVLSPPSHRLKPINFINRNIGSARESPRRSAAAHKSPACL